MAKPHSRATPLPSLVAVALALAATLAAPAGAQTVHDTSISCSSGLPKLQSSSKAACEAHVAVLNQVLAACHGAGAGVLSCTDAAQLQAPSGSCASAAGNVNAALREFRGPDGSAEDVKCAFDVLLHDTSACAATAATMTSMVRAFANGGFQDCVVSTPTTSPTTTTLTTTATTSPTTTPHIPALECGSSSGNSFIGGGECDVDAIYLTRCGGAGANACSRGGRGGAIVVSC